MPQRADAQGEEDVRPMWEDEDSRLQEMYSRNLGFIDFAQQI